jgi:hypothetical protein
MIPAEVFASLAAVFDPLQEVSRLFPPACAPVANIHRLATPAVLPEAYAWLRVAVADYHEKTVGCPGTGACCQAAVACILAVAFSPRAAAASHPVVDVSHHAAVPSPLTAAAGSPDPRCASGRPTRSFFPPHELVWGRLSPIHALHHRSR